MNEESERYFKYFEFRGSGSEFFRIWIVNIVLTILTLGIYSAWAKVRTNRYIYANSYLNGSSFEYLADPFKILLGRLLIVSIYALFIISGQFLGNFYLAGIIAIAFVLVLPLLFRQAVAFRFKNTSYRNIPFAFDASIGEFYIFFIVHALLNIVTFGLAFPFTYAKYKALIINHANYGNGNFSFAGTGAQVYGIFLKVFGVMFVISSALGVIVSSISTDGDGALSSLLIIFIFIGYLAFIIVMALMQGIIDALISNWIRNNSMLQTAPLKGEMKPFSLGWIVFINTLLTLLTLGLYYPWAKVRYLAYTLKHTAIECQYYDQFFSNGYEESSTIGEEAMDFFDIDLGL